MNVQSFQWVSAWGATLTYTSRGRARTLNQGQTDTYAFLNGTGAGMVNNEYEDASGTIAAGGTFNLDLSGVLVDESGATIAATSVRAMKFVNASANNGTVIRLGAGTNPWLGPWGATGTHDVQVGEVSFVSTTSAGWAVTAGTGDILKILNLDGVNAAAYRLYLALVA